MMLRFAPILFIASLVVACSTKTDIDIAGYELEHHQISISRIKGISAKVPFYASDSIAICEKLLTEEKARLIATQKQYIDTLDIQIDKIKNDTSVNPQLAKAMSNILNSMQYKRKIAQQVVDAYENSPQSTSLQLFTNKIDYYRNLTDTLLGYTQQAVFSGRQGMLPKETFVRNYFLTADGITIVGETSVQ